LLLTWVVCWDLKDIKQITYQMRMTSLKSIQYSQL
jgi:hypothetical protein